MWEGPKRVPLAVDAALEAGMRAFGATDAQVAQARSERGFTVQVASAEEFEVWPENWALWQFFLRAQTQWHYAAQGLRPAVRVGMNYEGVRSVALLRGVPPEQMQAWADDLHVIEMAVLVADCEMARRPTTKTRVS